MNSETSSPIFILVLVLGFVVLLLSRLRQPVHIDARGLRIVALFKKPLSLAWTEIEDFGVATVTRTEGGLYDGSERYVGIRLQESSVHKDSSVCVTNRQLSEYDFLLGPDRGMSVEQFVAFLKGEKAKYQSV